MENEYNIKLIGLKYKKEGYSDFIYIENNQVRDITGKQYSIDAKINELYILIDEVLIESESWSKISMLPIFLISEGIEQNFFMTRREFEESMVKSKLLESFTREEIVKFTYKADLESIISSIQSYCYLASKTLLEANSKMNEFLLNNENVLDIDNRDREAGFEYKESGVESSYVMSMYINTIIQMCSTLDMLAKLVCEIDKFPTDFSSNIKFKSGDIYFNRISRFYDSYKSYKGFKDSFIYNKNLYNHLILSRNMIIHESFLSTGGNFHIGYKTKVVNNKPIYYILTYIWDKAEDGKPERWLNRKKFYGEENEITEYLVDYLIKFYDNMESTIDIIIQHLISKFK